MSENFRGRGFFYSHCIQRKPCWMVYFFPCSFELYRASFWLYDLVLITATTLNTCMPSNWICSVRRKCVVRMEDHGFKSRPRRGFYTSRASDGRRLYILHAYVCAAVHAVRASETIMFPRYFQLLDFRQTFVIGASWNKDWVCDWVFGVKGQKAEASRKGCRVFYKHIYKRRRRPALESTLPLSEAIEFNFSVIHILLIQLIIRRHVRCSRGVNRISVLFFFGEGGSRRRGLVVGRGVLSPLGVGLGRGCPPHIFLLFISKWWAFVHSE